jgi:hypothetical protein
VPLRGCSGASRHSRQANWLRSGYTKRVSAMFPCPYLDSLCFGGRALEMGVWCVCCLHVRPAGVLVTSTRQTTLSCIRDAVRRLANGVCRGLRGSSVYPHDAPFFSHVFFSLSTIYSSSVIFFPRKEHMIPWGGGPLFCQLIHVRTEGWDKKLDLCLCR